MGNLHSLSLPFLLLFTASARSNPDQIAIIADEPQTGCGSPLPEGVIAGALGTEMSIVSHGVPRSYLLHVPVGYNNTALASVYFSFHGATKDASEQEGLSQFSNNTLNPYGIAVYPQGLNNKWLSNPTVDTSFPNDLDFMLDLLDELKKTLCINNSSIFAAGKSNGGGFVHTIACNSTVGPNFAAFASVSGAYYNSTSVPGLGSCEDPGKPFTPFLELHGLQDCIAPYNGQTTSVEAGAPKFGVPEFLNLWLENNGCDSDQVSNPTSTSQPYGSYVTAESWTCSGNQGILQHYKEAELGHIWPSLEPNDDCMHMSQCGLGPNCPIGRYPNRHYVFEGTEIILAFFNNHTLFLRG